MIKSNNMRQATLSEKLDEALLDGYPRSMRRAIREYRSHLVLKEARRPLEGIYWWVPVPIKGTDKFEWTVVPFHEETYGELLHSEMWDHILDDMKANWGLKSIENLRQAYAGLPRGRLVKNPYDPGYTIYHGNDSPGPMSKVYSAFNFTPRGNNKVVFDEHEQMLGGDPEELQRELGTDLGLSGQAASL